MIKFNPTKERKVMIKVLIENIDPSQLNFNFVIKANNVEYGFKGKYVNEVITFDIPPLSEIVKSLDKEYDSELRIDDGQKFFIMPWTGKSKIDLEPKIKIQNEDLNEDNEIKIATVSILDEEKENSNDDDDKKKKKKLKKESKLSIILGKE